MSVNYRKKLSNDEKARFCVAPDGWSSSGEFAEPDKETKKKRALKLKKTCAGRKEKQKCLSLKDQRFGTEAANPEVLATLSKPYAPKNTQLNTQWAMNNLRDWWNGIIA